MRRPINNTPFPFISSLSNEKNEGNEFVEGHAAQENSPMKLCWIAVLAEGAAGKTNNQSMKESRKRKRFIFLFELRDWNWFIVGYAGGAASAAATTNFINSFNWFRLVALPIHCGINQSSISLNQLTQQIKKVWFIGFVVWFHWLIDFILVNNGARWIFTSYN